MHQKDQWDVNNSVDKRPSLNSNRFHNFPPITIFLSNIKFASQLTRSEISNSRPISIVASSKREHKNHHGVIIIYDINTRAQDAETTSSKASLPSFMVIIRLRGASRVPYLNSSQKLPSLSSQRNDIR